MDDEQRALLLSRLSTAQPPPLSPVEALRNFWVKALTYGGRATRSEYNYALAVFVVSIFVPGLMFKAGAPRPLSTALGLVVYLVFTVPWLALIARRFHDTNRRGWLGFLMLVRFLGFIVTEGFLMFAESDPRGIRFDPEPTFQGSS